MKLPLLILLTCSLHSLAQERIDIPKDKLSGKVKLVTEQEYKITKKFGRNHTRPDSRTTYQYDKDGNETNTDCYFKDGSLDYDLLLKYDHKKRLIESTLSYAAKAVDTRSLFKYDEKNQQTEQDDYDEHGALTAKHLFYYDAKGNQVKFISYRSGDTLVFKAINTFDNTGNKTAEDYYGPNDSLEFKIKFTYDAQGREIEQDYFNPTGTLEFKLAYKYEEMDKQGNWLKETIYENDKPHLVNKREIVYY